MKKIKTTETIQVEFQKEHLYVLISALETYSRLQSGQIGMALDNVYIDRDLTWDEKEHIQNTIRYYAFPQVARKEYDGHGGFFDQYNNEYNENGEIINESEEWKRFKTRPHLDHPNSSFGVGCKEAKNGTIAFEIRKVIEQYFHYERNNGMRKISDVSGDGIKWSYSGVPAPKVVGFEPVLKIKIPKKHKKTLDSFFLKKDWKNLWFYAENTIFKKKPLPRGNKTKFQKDENENWQIIVEEPYS